MADAPNIQPFLLRSARHAVRLAVFALISASALPAFAADGKSGQLYEDALVRYEKKDYAGAIIQLKNALQLDNKQLPVHVLLGKALFASGQAAAAEAALTEALRQGVSRAEVAALLARTLVAQGRQQEVIDDPRFQVPGLGPGAQAQLLLVKAAAYSDLGDGRSALKALEDARAADPDSPEGWLAEVPVRIRAREFKEALEAVAKARAIDPQSAAVMYEYGSILHVQGDLAGALAAYDKSLAADPDLIDPRVARAGLLIDLKRDADAAKDVAVLVDKNALEPRGWYLGAVLAERQGRQQSVNASLRKITDLLDPVPLPFLRYRPQLLLLGGQAHYGLGESEKAKPYFEGFQRLQPGSPVSKLLANIYISEGNQDRAAESLELYLRSSPNDSQAMALLASSYMAQGRNARASELMQRALKTQDAAELYTAYGLSLLGSGQTENATTQLENAYRKDPGQAQAAVALVGLYLKGNQVAKARAIADALVKRQPNNPGYQNLLGMAKAQARDVPGARAAFEQAAKLDSTMLQATLNLARLEESVRNTARALALLDSVLKVDENNTEAMYERADMAERAGQSEEARRWLQKAYDIAGAKDLRASLALVDLHMRHGRLPDALKICNELAASLPDNLPVLMALTRAQLSGADLPGARNTLTTATRVAAFDAPVQVEIALLQLLARNLPGAAYSLDKALSAKPGYFPAVVLLTEVETKQGEFVKAEAHVQEVIRREPRLAVGYSLQGDLAMTRGQLAPAIDAYRKAHQIQPSSETFSRLFVAMAQQNAKSAIQFGEQWVNAHANDVAARKVMAEAYVRIGDLASAKKTYQRLRELSPSDVGAINNLANVLLLQNDPQALPVAEQALAAAPSNPTVIDTAGWIAFKTGKVDRAVELLRDARLRNPEKREIRYHLAAALAQIGRKAEAREELEAALRGKTAFDGRQAAEALMVTLK